MKGSSKRKSARKSAAIIIERPAADGKSAAIIIRRSAATAILKSGSAAIQNKRGKARSRAPPRYSSAVRKAGYPHQKLLEVPSVPVDIYTKTGRRFNKVQKRSACPVDGLASYAPSSSITACHVCLQITKPHKWCLRSLNCGFPLEEIDSGHPSAAFMDVPKDTTDVSMALNGPGRENLDLPSTTTADGVQSQRPPKKLRSVPGASAPPQIRIDYDPFDSMRLDIDDMSYEELLELQEHIGYVSTGLSEEELGKSRKVSVYRVKLWKTTKHKEVDSRCSICQEEYRSGDKMGKLKCHHSYHVVCIDQWLRQKKWCPTCKASVSSG